MRTILDIEHETTICQINKHIYKEAYMIGESKLWMYDKENNVWNIIKVFHTSATIIERLTWLEIMQTDNPSTAYALSQHNPSKSVGE